MEDVSSNDLVKIPHCASYYQELTYTALHEKMVTAAKAGNSEIYLYNSYMGREMQKFLERKGFAVYNAPSYKKISW